MTDISVRKALPEDSGEIAEILSSDLGYPCSSGLVREKLICLDGGREAVFAAFRGERMAGVVHVEMYELLYMETFANILGLAVREEFRRRGIGRRLMLAAEKWAKENGAAGVRLNSGGTRTEAHEFYRAVGYTNEKPQIRFMKKF